MQPRSRFPEVEARGAPRVLGRQIGEACREQVRGYVQLLLERFDRSALATAAAAVPFAERFAPDAMEELRGTAEAAGVSVDEVMLINVRNQLAAASDGCTSIVVEPRASASAGGIAAQNWDNDPATDGLSVVLTRRPAGKPAFMCFTRPGEIAYIGLSDAGVGLLMNALPGRPRATGVPWYFLARAIYEHRALAAMLADVERAERAMPVSCALITPDGAADLEMTPEGVWVLRADARGLLVHANHCAHPALRPINEACAAQIFGRSHERSSRAQHLLADRSGAIAVDDLQRILTDHDGHPQSICRHRNDHPLTGEHTTIVSMIVEPAAGRMHLTRGNPCQRRHELYRLA
jgi:isopenicillin-N N-acyltransferase-like protein